MDEIGVDELFKVVGGGAVIGVDDADDAKAGVLDQSLVGVPEAVANDGPDATNHGEMLYGDVPTAIGGGLKSGSLNGDREKVEVIQKGRKAVFTDDGTRELFRYLLQGLRYK